jgi:DNA-binding NtrC family response regulator
LHFPLYIPQIRAILSLVPHRKSILLVDDEPELLSMLTEMVKGFGYSVVAKPDAESALMAISEGVRVDLAITDLRLPGMSGMDLIREMKKARPGIPIIMLTAFGSVESYIETRSNGVFEYLNKPIQSRELKRIIKTALETVHPKSASAKM